VLTRSNFLAATAAAPMLATAAPVSTAPRDPTELRTDIRGAYVFDRARFERTLARPVKHRQAIAWPELDSGSGLHYAQNALRAYADGFDGGPAAIHVAVVVYGTAILALLPQPTWKAFSLATYVDRLDAARRLGSMARSGEAINPYLDRVEALAKDDVTFFVCNNALHGVTQAIASNPEAHGAGTDEVYAAFASAIVPLPYAQIVPAGIAALNAAQEARFTFFQASI